MGKSSNTGYESQKYYENEHLIDFSTFHIKKTVTYVRNGKKVSKAYVDTPSVIHKYCDGWLLGSDRGEFGGELVYFQNDGSQKILLNKQIKDIHKLHIGYAVVSGLNHLFTSSGKVYLINNKLHNEPTINELLTLPSAPKKSYININGELIVECYRGEIIKIDGSK